MYLVACGGVHEWDHVCTGVCVDVSVHALVLRIVEADL